MIKKNLLQGIRRNNLRQTSGKKYPTDKKNAKNKMSMGQVATKYLQPHEMII